MIKKKILKERLITLKEFEEITENRKRVFRINYCTMGGTIRSDKWFQNKMYVNNFINNPRVNKIKIYVGDVVDEQEI